MSGEEFVRKVVLVTGASRGIGLEICRRFVELGAAVVMAARSESQLAIAVSSVCNRTLAHPFACDLSCEPEIDRLFAFIRDRFGRIDVLVNNLGAFSEKVEWNAIDHDLWIKSYETNTLSAYFCMVRASEMMVEQGVGGAIVNLGSSSALQLKRGRMHYSASKAAVNTITKIAALDLAKHQIRVNVVSPGPTLTERVQRRTDNPVEGLHEGERLKKIPMGRYASTTDIANAVIFLSSSQAEYITGAVLPVDGGYTIGETI